jgi:hypothetical protein
MSASGQNRRNEDYQSNDRFLIWKRTFAEVPVKGR